MVLPNSHCLMLLTHSMRRAFSFARDKAGNNRPARIAMTAMTINNSISVNPSVTFELFFMPVRMIQKRWVTPPNARDEVRRASKARLGARQTYCVGCAGVIRLTTTTV